MELREITDWEKPFFVKVGATRTYYDVGLAVKAGADRDRRGRNAGWDRRHARTYSSSMRAYRRSLRHASRFDALQELGMHRQVQLIVSGGIRTGADVAKRSRWEPMRSRSARPR